MVNGLGLVCFLVLMTTLYSTVYCHSPIHTHIHRMHLLYRQHFMYENVTSVRGSLGFSILPGDRTSEMLLLYKCDVLSHTCQQM